MSYLIRACVLLAIVVVVLAQVNPTPSEAETWATTVLNYGDQSTATSLDVNLTPLVFTKPDSFPLFQFDYEVSDKTIKMPTTGASTFGNTRAIALTHPGQFVGEGVTTEFWDSVLEWVTYGNLNAKIAVGFASHETFLQSLGATNVVLVDFDKSSVVLAPSDTDVLIMDYSSYNVWSNARMDRLYQTTAEFVSRSSAHGIVIGGQSRFFKWTHYGSCSLFPANRVFADVGIVYVCAWWGDRGFDMEVPTGNYLEHHLYHSVNYIKSITDVGLFQNSDAASVMEPLELATSLRGSFVGCFCGGDVNAPIVSTYDMHSILVDIIESGNCLVQMPMGSTESAERLCDDLAYYAAFYSSDPHEVVTVPSSSAFPLLDEDFSESDFVTVTADIESDRCGDLSTGIFVGPGRVVQLTIPQEWVGFVRAAVGQWRGNTAKFATWTRNPNPIKFYYDLPTATTEIASGFGGMLYIEVDCADDFVDHFAGLVSGQIEATNVLKAVYFHSGLTDQADWDAQLAVNSDHIAPWMELETRDLIFTVPRAFVEALSFTHMQEVADYWDYVTELYSNFRDKQPDEFKERGVTDTMVAYGYMFASYPMVGPLGESRSVFNLDAFYASGTWGWLHEIGHRYERGNSYGPEAGRLWNMFSGNVEVFTNVFTCQAIDNTRAENSRCSSGARGISDSLAGKDWSDMGPFQKLDFYINQKLTFGWEPLTHAMSRGRTYRFPEDDIERRTRLWLLYSEEVGRNVRPMFDAWGIAVDEDLLYEQLLLVDQVSVGLRFSSPMSDLGEDEFADYFAVGAALLGQAPPDRLFSSSASATFGGSNNGDIAGPMAFNTGTDMTVSIWLFLDSASIGASLVEVLDSGLASQWALKVGDNGQNEPVLEFSWPSGSIFSEQVLTVGSWMHIAVTSDSSQGVFYINGELESSFSTAAFGSDPSDIIVFNYGGLLEGSLAELGYFEAVLTGDRIFAQWSPSPLGFAPWLTAGFMPTAPSSCPAHVLPQGIVACNSFDGIQNQPTSDCDACLAFICDGAAAPAGVDCSSTCKDGFVVNPNGICDECHSTCAACTVADDSNACSRCDASTGFPYSEGTTCVNGCTDGFTLVGATCLACDSTCATCDGTSAGDCLSCDSLLFEDGFCVATCSPGNVEHEGECISECPTGFFDAAGVCEGCASSCETCSGAASNECITCSNSFPFLSLDNSCLSACPAGQFADGFTCFGCLDSCATCADDTSCTTCDQGGATPWYFEFNCLSVCPMGTTPDTDTFVCNGCDIYSDEPFDNEGECVAMCPIVSYEHQCVSACPSGHFANGDNDCRICDTNCESCADTATTCTSCSSGGNFPFLLNEECLSECPEQFYGDGDVCQECHATCETCEGPTSSDCLTCASALPNFLEGECLSECPAGFFSNAFQCAACDAECFSCTGGSATECDSCHDGDFLLEGSCVNDCPAGTFATTDADVNVCLECDNLCLTCTGEASACTSCDLSSLFPVLEGFTCVEACDGFELDGDCVRSCPVGYFEDGDNCSLCDISCEACEESATNCLVCNRSGPTPVFDDITDQCLASCATVGRFAIEGLCVDSCPATLFANAATAECTECEAPCAECSGSATTCTSCGVSGPSLLLGTDCLSECPTGFYEATSYCLACHDSCESCDAAGATSCTGCSFGFVLDPSGACVEENFEECPTEVADLQSTSAVASWPDEHTSVSQDVLCLQGTSVGDHCIPYGSRLEASIDVEVALSATLLCAVCDNDNLISTDSKTLQQQVTVTVDTARSLRFLNSLLSADVVGQQLEELFQAASIDNGLNVHVLSLAEQQFDAAITAAGLEALCAESASVIEFPNSAADSQERVELAAVGSLSDEVCPFPDTQAWNDDSAYQARCICDDSVAGVEDPCSQLDFAPFSESSDSICHPVACTAPVTDEDQWIEVTVELNTNFFAFGDADTKEILSEIVNFLQLNTDVALGDVFLTRLDIGSVVMTLLIDSSGSFDDDYSAAEVLVDDLNSAVLSLSVPVIQATIVTPNNPPNSDSYTTLETNSYTTVVTNSYTTVVTNSYTTVETNSFSTADTNSLSTTDTSSSSDDSTRTQGNDSSSSDDEESDEDNSSSTASSASALAATSTLVVLCMALVL